MTPTRPRSEGLVHKLAKSHGVSCSYVDQHGARQVVSDASLIAILQALGAIEDPSGIADALHAKRASRNERVLEEVIALREDRPMACIHLADAAELDDAGFELIDESGATTTGRLRELVSDAPFRATRNGIEGALDLSCLNLSIGYHELVVRRGDLEHKSLLLCAPARLGPPPKSWGLFASTYGLRQDEAHELGSYSSLEALVRLAARSGARFVATLPLYATFYEGGFDPSPYRPVSRLFWNELFVDPERAPELQATAGRVMESTKERRLERHIDYLGAYRRQREVLSNGLAHLSDFARRREAFEAFVHNEPELLDYARFRAVEADGDPRASERYHCYAQWLATSQLEAIADSSKPHRTTGLLLDFPIGVHPHGYDAWRYSELFATEAVIGAPPDAFFAQGQQWGFHPIHPGRQRRDGYRYLRRCLAKTLRYARAVRLDHILGLERLFWIPKGASAEEGTYVANPLEELRAVVLIEAARADAIVVGEDLGTVSPRIRRAMDEDGILHSFVAAFEHDKRGRLKTAPVASMASLGTHDLARFATTVAAPRDSHTSHSNEHSRKMPSATTTDRDRSMTGSSLKTTLCGLLASQSALVMIDLGDLLGEKEPENRPGTFDERNWSLVLDTTIRRLELEGQLESLLDRFAGELKQRSVHAHGE